MAILKDLKTVRVFIAADDMKTVKTILKCVNIRKPYWKNAIGACDLLYPLDSIQWILWISLRYAATTLCRDFTVTAPMKKI